MNLKQVDLWANWLWKHYLPYVKTGEPFFLAADGSLIAELMRQNGQPDVTVEVALQSFHDSCLLLLSRSSTKASVRDEAFRKIDGEFYSRVICLAVQQVLVVELMLSDNDYSEQSYFPRYCACLQLSQAREHLNPLGSAYFQAIWNTLEQEIKSVPGSAPSTITFFTGSGSHLNKSLPFSQALFTTHDLTVIREKSSLLKGQNEEQVIFQSLHRTRNYLGSRAQRLILIADPVVRVRLAKQVQSFLLNYEKLSILRPKFTSPLLGNSYFVAFLDSEDLFSDRFSIYLRSEQGQSDGNSLDAALQAHLLQQQHLILVARGDRYQSLSSDECLEPDDAVLIVLDKNTQQTLIEKISRLYGPEKIKLETPEANLSPRFGIVYFGRIPDSRINALLGLAKKELAPQGIEFEGGLLADARSRIFLADYPPVSIRFRGASLEASFNMLVNGTRTSIGEFLTKVSQQEEFTTYLVQIDDEKISLAVSPRDFLLPITKQFGYLLDKREFSPSAYPLDDNQPGLRGAFFQGFPELKNTMSEHSSAVEVFTSSNYRFLPLPSSAISQVIVALESFGNTPAVSLLKQQIVVSNRVPLSPPIIKILKKLEILKA